MTKKEQSEAITSLRETLKPGDTVYTILRHVSRSGMMRHIDLYKMTETGPQYLSGLAHVAGVGSGRTKDGALKAGGCGMDMGFALVYELSSILYRDGFDCTGDKCPSNDHSNAWNAARSGSCAVCGNALVMTPVEHCHSERCGDDPETCYCRCAGCKSQPHHINAMRGNLPVCSHKCAVGVWRHRSGGYALNQRWL